MHNVKVTKIELLYFIAVGIYLFVQLLSSTLFSAIYDLTSVRLISFFTILVLLTIKLIVDNSYKRVWLYMLILVVFLVVGLNATGIRDLIILGYLTIEARNIDINKIIKEYIYITLIVLIITISLYYIGIFDSIDTTIVRSTGTIRRSLGFGWTTYAANYFFSLILCVLFLEPKKKYRGLLCLSLALIAYFLYIATDTRVAFYESIGVIIMYYLIVSINIQLDRFKVLRAIIPSVFVISAAFSIWISLIYDSGNPVMVSINQLSSNRLDLGHRALQMYSIGLWGNAIEWVTSGGDNYFYVDSSYVQLVLQYGILILIYVVSLFTLLTRHYMYRRNTIAVLVFAMIAIHSITDPQLFNLAYNPFLLTLGTIVANWKETNLLKKETKQRRKKRRNKVYIT